MKRKGESVTLKWTEWPDGKPTPDPTTGSSITGVGQAPVQRSLTFKALVHFIAPAVNQVRQHQEVAVGDAIIDFIPQLVKVTAVGNTSLTLNQLCTIYDLNAANRALTSGQTAATSTDIDLWALEDPRFEIAGSTWTQKPIGEGLAKSWDANFGGIVFSRPFLLRKAT